MVTQKLTKKEVEKLVTDMYKEGITSEKIGLALKEKHGVKNFRKEFGMKISEVIGKNDADSINVKKRLENLKRHLETNKKDQPAKRRLIKTASHFKKVESYLAR